MAIDPELAAVVDLLPDMEALDLQARRDAVTAMVDAVQTVDADVEARVRIEDRRVPGPPGAPEVPVRIYTPTTGEGPYPLLMCFHGGAFMVGTMAMDHATGVDVADRLQAIAVAVEYRLAPENPYPAGVEDCYAATVWAADSGELDVDRSRVVVSGASAGGALAAAVALMARDRGGPSISFQILNIPVLDDRMDTPSMRDHVATPMFHRPGAETMWDNYLGVDRGPAPAYAAPARADDLAGLPPAYIQVAELDPLRDEGIQYALRLLGAGVSVELHAFPGTFHGSGLVTTAAVSRRAAWEQADVLQRALRG